MFDQLAPPLLASAGFDLPPAALDVMRIHFDLLQRWNSKTNLTSIRDPRQIIERHFMESLHLLRAIKLGPGVLYDIGSGGGFPGLPVKAAVPEVELVMVESHGRKATFLKEVIRAAGMKKARVEGDRLENLLQRAEVELADWVTMRAVEKMRELVPLIHKLLIPHGKAALFVGEQDAGEIRNNAGGFSWHPNIPLPGSEHRVILIGESLAA